MLRPILLTIPLALLLATAPEPTPPAPTPAPATSAPSSRPDMTPRLAPNTELRPDVPYVPNPAPLQKLDIYSPHGVTNAPILVFIHGGEWARGDKHDVSYKPQFFNNHNIVFIAVNYRLSATDKHPAQVNDVASALRWIKDNAGTFGGDPDKIVLLGHSAGCHLVTLTTLDPRILANVNLKPTDLAGTVAWSGGAYDLVEKLAGGGMYPDYIRKNFGEEPRALREASPINHIAEDPTPPMLIASAGAGNPASREISERMAALLQKANANATTLLLEGKSHVNANHEVGAPNDLTGDQLLAWIAKVTNTPTTTANAK